MEAFTAGQRVRLSDKARERGITVGRTGSRSERQRREVFGTVAAVVSGDRLLVRPDGNKTAVAYSAEFWTDATDSDEKRTTE